MAGKKNNATSSWSGYNHQGQVGIFLALKELNSLLHKSDDYSNYSIQFEKENGEDIGIVQNKIFVSKHQVKAKTNGKYPNAYKDVLIGVKKKKVEKKDEEFTGWFNTESVDENSRYLHTICEVIGFGLPQNNFDFLFQNQKGSKPTFVENPYRVKLYQYPDGKKYCKLSGANESKIDNFCKTEIKNILVLRNHSLKDDDDHINETLFELKDLLCTKIRVAHETGGGANPEILFSEIYEIVMSTKKREKQAIRRAKKLFGLYWNEYSDRSVDESIINEILNLADKEFQKLLIDLHPDGKILKLKDMNNLDNLIDATSFEYILCEFIKWYQKDKFILDNLHYQTNQESFRLSMIHAPKPAAGEVKDAIMKNIDFIKASFDTDYLINMNIDGKKFFEEQPIHEEGKEEVKSNLLGKTEDNIFSINLEYIDCESTIKKLKEDQGGDE